MKHPFLQLTTCFLMMTYGFNVMAYVRTMTCHEGASIAVDPLACAENQTPVPIYWDSHCLTYYINDTPPDEVELDLLEEAVQLSFDEWSGQSCSGMSVHFAGYTDEYRVGYNKCDGAQNANIVTFVRSGWPHQSQALALTSVTYNLDTGLIVDADMELNDQNFTFTTSNLAPLVRIDVQNTITHEGGHFLGLDHSTIPESTMYATAQTGDLFMRDLHEDDIDAICSIYPDQGGEACPQPEIGYFNRPEFAQQDTCLEDRGCQCTQRNPSSEKPWQSLLMGLSIVYMFFQRTRLKVTS